MNNPFTFKLYDFTLAGGGVQALPAMGSYFRIMSSTGPVEITVEGRGTATGLQAGQGFKDQPYTKLLVRDVSGAPNSGVILAASAEFFDNRMNGTFDLSAASLAALESIDLNAATQLGLRTPLQESGYNHNNTAVAASTPQTIFTPGANVAGAIVLTGSISMYNVGNVNSAFLAKSSAPATVFDGSPVLTGSPNAGATGAAIAHVLLPQQVYVPAGLGLYFIADAAVPSANGWRSVRYRFL